MKKITAIIITALALAACTEQTEFSVPDAQRSYEFEAAGATEFATISTTDFTASCSADWVYTEIYKGSKEHNLRITVHSNTRAADRTAEIVLTPEGLGDAATITLHQKGASPYIKLQPGSVSLTMDDSSFNLTSVSNCSYEVETPDWIKLAGSEASATSDSCRMIFNVLGEVKLGEKRSGYITLSGSGLTARAFVEQIGAKWETVTMTWGLSDIQYIWQAFGKTTAAITTATVAATDFSDFPRLKAEGGSGFAYTNEVGHTLHAVMSSDAQLKINKAGSKTSTGNINRDGENVERIQMNKATSGVGENSFMFIAPRSGILEIEAASPNSGDKKPQIMVDGAVISETFQVPYAIPSSVSTLAITVTAEEGAEVRIYGTNGAINYFQISYTYERPVFE